MNRLATLSLLVGAIAWSPSDPNLQPMAERVPQIELRAPGAFDDPDRPVISEIQFNYQVDATVLLPLLFVSIPLARRDDVGFGNASSRDFHAERGMRLRTYEFFATSIPERARGLNRLGFLREALLVKGDAVRSTAHFGVVSSNREQTREEAETLLDRDESVQPYTVLDGFTEQSQTSYEVTKLELERRWPTAGALYADLKPRWQAAEPDEEATRPNRDGQRYSEPGGFLGGFQHSLRAAAADLARGVPPRRLRQPFIHHGKVYRLELRGHSVDEGRRRRYVEAHLAAHDATIHKIEYRIRNDRGDTVQDFKLWTELPATSAGTISPASLPIAFEFKARSFLELKAVRVLDRDTP